VNGAVDCAEAGWRLSATQLERTLAAAAATILEDRAGIALASEAASKDDQLPAVLKSAQTWAERLRSTTGPCTPPTHRVGHREIARREDSRILGDLRPPRLSLGPHAKAKRALTRGFRSIL